MVAETVVLARVSPTEQATAGRSAVDHRRRSVDDHLYIVPPTEYPDGHVYVKLGATRHDQWIVLVAERAAGVDDGAATTKPTSTGCAACCSGCLPGLHAEAWSTKPCLIPETPTKLPYLEIVEPGW